MSVRAQLANAARPVSMYLSFLRRCIPVALPIAVLCERLYEHSASATVFFTALPWLRASLSTRAITLSLVPRLGESPVAEFLEPVATLRKGLTGSAM